MVIRHYDSKPEFFKDMHNVLKSGDTVLVKASHGMEFPEIVDRLTQE